METNLAVAIKNIATMKNITNLHAGVGDSSINSSNRINIVGENLENFIKDAFAGCLKVGKGDMRKKRYEKYFSYTGNQNNPPDIILKNSDAIEIKKIQNESSDIALNSSYPKAMLFADDPMITVACRNCEVEKNWRKKDMLYVVGVVKENIIKSIWFIYGNCYAADREVYAKAKDKISSAVENSGLEISKTNEIGRINRVDPLGITNLRIRGVWHIQNPNKVFADIVGSEKYNFSMNALLLKRKYESLPAKDKIALEKLHEQGKISIQGVRIANPNNPVKQLNAKWISLRK